MKDVSANYYEHTDQTSSETREGGLRRMTDDLGHLSQTIQEVTRGFTSEERERVVTAVGENLEKNIGELWDDFMKKAKEAMQGAIKEIQYSNSPEGQAGEKAYKDLMQQGRESDQKFIVDEQYDSFRDSKLEGQLRALADLAAEGKVVTIDIENSNYERVAAVVGAPFEEYGKRMYPLVSDGYKAAAWESSGIVSVLPRTEDGGFILHATIGQRADG
ncbi:MAG: hypothetical protein J2P37_27120 [Ktedonobacteraceae bacterium]|nr:hypothetical protein [Ktedonobacteraceae bacterium]MBO0793595.1 hypothetical protein [Ktedonobacteraceae bacterium]